MQLYRIEFQNMKKLNFRNLLFFSTFKVIIIRHKNSKWCPNYIYGRIILINFCQNMLFHPSTFEFISKKSTFFLFLAIIFFFHPTQPPPTLHVLRTKATVLCEPFHHSITVLWPFNCKPSPDSLLSFIFPKKNFFVF